MNWKLKSREDYVGTKIDISQLSERARNDVIYLKAATRYAQAESDLTASLDMLQAQLDWLKANKGFTKLEFFDKQITTLTNHLKMYR